MYKRFGFHFQIVFLLTFLAVFLFLPRTAQAAALSLPKDTITTSRPSAAAPLSANVAVAATSFTFDDNKSRYLASDSAKFYPDTGESLDTITVASMAGTTVYLAGKTTNTHHKGAAVIVPVTATHTISFTTVSSVPSNGLIKVIFPVGDTTNAASPSASGFSFNNLGSNNLTISGATCGSWTPTASTGLVQCNLSVAITAPTAITITVGAVGAGTSGPVLINPTKTAAAGIADTWAVQIQTTESTGAIIDNSKVKIGTIESVQVYATVEPYLTFTIAGMANGIAINTGNTNGCTNTEIINTGFTSSTTEVNLGVLGAGVVNIGAQLITITTNGWGGYALTATSSGHLIDPGIGYWIADAQGTPTNNDAPAPSAGTMIAGTPQFGIHPCGVDVAKATWVEGGASQTCTTGSGTKCYYANPSPAYYYTLASDTTGPIGDTSLTGNGLTSIEYAAAISAVVPAGTYRTAMTYVATPTF